MMPAGLLFWMLMILWLIFGTYVFWPINQSVGGPFGVNLLLFVLLALLGWKTFGKPIQ